MYKKKKKKKKNIYSTKVQKKRIVQHKKIVQNTKK